MKMKKGHELKIRERLSKSYLQVIFIASISAIVGIIGALIVIGGIVLAWTTFRRAAH